MDGYPFSPLCFSTVSRCFFFFYYVQTSLRIGYVESFRCVRRTKFPSGKRYSMSLPCIAEHFCSSFAQRCFPLVYRNEHSIFFQKRLYFCSVWEFSLLGVSSVYRTLLSISLWYCLVCLEHSDSRRNFSITLELLIVNWESQGKVVQTAGSLSLKKLEAKWRVSYHC